MHFDVLAIPPFDRQVKRLLKKYPSLKKDLLALIASLEQKPHQGTPLGSQCYKIRLSISSKGKGKSGGGRVITYVQATQHAVYLLSIYDKSESDTITHNDITTLLELLPRA